MIIRYLLFISMFIFFIDSAKGQDPLESPIGVGLFRVSLNSPIPLYHSIDDKKAYDTIKFERVSDGDDKGIFVFHTKDTKLIPYLYYSGSSDLETDRLISHGLTYMVPKLVFKVTTKSENTVEVILNEKTGKRGVIKFDDQHKLYIEGKSYWGFSNPQDAWYLYEAWETYLKRIMYINISELIPGYEQPDGDLIRNLTLSSGYKVLEVKDEWMKIGQFQEDPKFPEEVWIKWNDGYKPLIQFVEEVYF